MPTVLEHGGAWRASRPIASASPVASICDRVRQDARDELDRPSGGLGGVLIVSLLNYGQVKAE